MDSGLNVTEFIVTVRHNVSKSLWGPKRDSLWIVVPITVIYIIIFIFGVLGNISTCFVIACNKHMHTTTNYYLFSLAVSDLVFLISGLTPEMYFIWQMYPYPFGETICVYSGLVAETSTNATILTITAFTVERYIAICHPFLSHTVSKFSRVVKFIIGIWIASIFLAIPQAIQMGLVYEVDKNGTRLSDEYILCSIKETLFPSSFLISTIIFFVIPMTLIIVLYILIAVRLWESARESRQECVAQFSERMVAGSRNGIAHCVVRRSQRPAQHSKSTTRVVKMLVTVVSAFFICWAPFQVQRLFAIYGYDGANTSRTAVTFYKTVTYISGVLIFLSTAVNPVLYNVMSLKFRQAFKSTLTKCFGRRQRGDVLGCGGEELMHAGYFRTNHSLRTHRFTNPRRSNDGRVNETEV